MISDMTSGRMALRVVEIVASLLVVLGVVSTTAAVTVGDCVDVLSTASLIDRVSGSDRYATAPCASGAAHPDTIGGAAVIAGPMTSGQRDGAGIRTAGGPLGTASS